jgi:hypothetical protein
LIGFLLDLCIDLTYIDSIRETDLSRFLEKSKTGVQGMKIASRAIYAASLCLFLGCSQPPAQDPPVVLFSEDFQSGALSADWVNINASASTAAITGTENALTAGDTYDGMVIYYGGTSSTWTNYSVSCKIKLSSVTGSLAFFARTNPRSDNTKTYYQCSMSYNSVLVGYDLAIYKGVSGASYPLMQSTTTNEYTAGTYYNAKVVVNDGNIKVYFDNMTTPLFEGTDDGVSYGGAVIPAGSFGFGASGCIIYVDDIAVTQL